MHLSAFPRPENLLADNEALEFVTVTADHAAGHFCFVAFDPQTLRVRWIQRAPGPIADPRGLKDHRGREGLRRATLTTDFRHLLDRFQPSTLVFLAETIPQPQHLEVAA